MDRKLIDDTGERGADIGARQAILDCDAPVGEFGDLGGSRAELALRFGAGVVVDGDDLQVDAARAGSCAGDAGADLAEFAGKAGELTVGDVDARSFDEPLSARAFTLLYSPSTSLSSSFFATCCACSPLISSPSWAISKRSCSFWLSRWRRLPSNSRISP